MTTRSPVRAGWALLALLAVAAASVEGLAYWRRNHLDLALTLRAEHDLAVAPRPQDNGWTRINWPKISELLSEVSLARSTPKTATGEATTSEGGCPARQEILAITDGAMRSKRFVEPFAVTPNTYKMLQEIQRLESLQTRAAVAAGSALEAVGLTIIRMRAWIDLASTGRSFWAQRAGFSGTKLTAADLESACIAAGGATGKSQVRLPTVAVLDPARFVLASEAPARLLAAGYLLGAEEARYFYHKYREDTVFALLAKPESVSRIIDACFMGAQSPTDKHQAEELARTAAGLRNLDAGLVHVVCEMMETAVNCASETKRQLPQVQDRIDASLRCVRLLVGD